jgi:hypothetical protein
MNDFYLWDGLHHCTARGCCCGLPVNIRIVNGRPTPIHIR